MALKTDKDGNYIVKSTRDAERALRMMLSLAEEIEELEEKYGIREMMKDSVALKKAATDFMVSNEIDTVLLPDGRYGKIIQQAHNRRWILNKSDIDPRAPQGVKSLKQILKKKFGPDKGYKKMLNRITKRIVDPNALQEVVSEGLLTEKEIAPAYVEEQKSPYLRMYGGDE